MRKHTLLVTRVATCCHNFHALTSLHMDVKDSIGKRHLVTTFPQRLTLQCRNLQKNSATMLLDAYNQGRTKGDVARHMGVCRASIDRRYNNTGSTRDRPRSGRPRRSTPAHDRYIGVMHRTRFRTATSTASQIPGLRRISSQTDINRLR